jgi:large subunit ribosomal protein L46
MNTWIVGNHPVGHFKRNYAEHRIKVDDRGLVIKSDMVFFMKGRIMAGQANLTNSLLGAKDFKWLTKEEIQPIVHKRYWSVIQDILPER